MIYGFGEVVTIRGWDIKKLEGDIGIKVLTQGIMLLCRPPLGNGILCPPSGSYIIPRGPPRGFLYHPSGYALGMIKKPLGGPLGMIKSPSGVHKIPYPSGGVNIITHKLIGPGKIGHI